ncbi:hypothetical protein [Bacillus thuringiensis]|uniref:hypothetical protein n=1 Tax=Bacillus thuringiensis TaxID=1428 RepID=UPI001F5BE497|nr:hypothetical protein [Bacillus thuringiensis]
MSDFLSTIEFRVVLMFLDDIAKVGQLQYLQPFLIIGFSVLFLFESTTWLTIVLAFIVVICVIVAKSDPTNKKEAGTS